MPEKKEDTILWLFIIGVWKFSHGFIFMRPVFRFFETKEVIFSYPSEVCFKALLTVAHLLNSCYSSDVFNLTDTISKYNILQY